jgi:hypothetical protein
VVRTCGWRRIADILICRHRLQAGKGGGISIIGIARDKCIIDNLLLNGLGVQLLLIFRAKTILEDINV